MLLRKNSVLWFCVTAKLDGISKPLRHTTIEDYLQMDGWEPPSSSKPGKKRVSVF